MIVQLFAAKESENIVMSFVANPELVKFQYPLTNDNCPLPVCINLHYTAN